MNEYSFEVRLRTVVRVRATSKDEASKVVESVLGSPSSEEIRLANEKNAALGRAATVMAADFQCIGAPRLITDIEPDAKAKRALVRQTSLAA
jgi:hypothetical protein